MLINDSPFNISRYTDTYGNLSIKKRTNRQFQIYGSKIETGEVLVQPNHVYITDFDNNQLYETGSQNQISDQTYFKVNYDEGTIYFHPAMEGKFVNVNFDAKARIDWKAVNVALRDEDNLYNATNAEDAFKEIITRVNNMVTNVGNSNSEIVDLRVDTSNVTHPTAKHRADSDYNSLLNKIGDFDDNNLSESSVAEAINNDRLHIADIATLIVDSDYKSKIENAPDGAYIIIPYRSTPHKITSVINVANKKITIDIRGNIEDRITSCPTPSTNVDCNGRGLFTFNNCNVKLIQREGITINGNLGTTGVDQTYRNIFYFYNCQSLKTDGLKTINAIGHCTASAGCTNIEENSGNHTNCEAILHSSCSFVKITNTKIFNARLNGITVENRGIIVDGNGFTNSRPQFVEISSCYVNGITSSNNYAVGITIDSCDNYKCYNNYVYGNNFATMAFSFANSTNGSTYGNKIFDFTNIANGTYQYCGVGMECEKVKDSEFYNNYFNNSLIGYLINNSQNCKFDGEYNLNTDSAISFTTQAALASYCALCGTVTANDNIIIKGNIIDSFIGVYFNGIGGEITIKHLQIKKYSYRGIETGITANINTFNIEDSKIVAKNTSSNQAININQNKITNVFCYDVYLIGNSSIPLAFTGYSTSGAIFMERCIIASFAAGIDFQSTWASVFINNIKFFTITGTLINGYGTSTNVVEDVRLNGVLKFGYGDEIQIAGAPTISAQYKTQKYLDTTNKKYYVATGVGSGASDWTILN